MLNKLNDCIKKLNYYKLEDVLISCFWRSRELHNQINFKDNLFPWELETLVMLNIKAKHEFDNEKFLDKHLNEKNVFDKLSITLKQFQDILDNCYSSVEDYYYGFCPLYSKPFLDLGKNLMIPLPHLLLRSVTTSMLEYSTI